MRAVLAFLGRLLWKGLQATFAWLILRAKKNHQETVTDHMSDSSLIMADPAELLDQILQWDQQEAQTLCNALNAYDCVLKRGIGNVAALDLRRIPSVKKESFFPMGTPTNVLAIDQHGRFVTINPIGSRQLYGIMVSRSEPAKVSSIHEN